MIQEEAVNIPTHPILEEDSNDSATICLDLFHLAEEDDCFEEILKKLNIRGLSEDELKIIDIKLKVLENWEMKKRRGLEILGKQLEELQEIENEIENLEYFIKSRNVEINEDDFLTFCQTQEPIEPTEDIANFLKELGLKAPKRPQQQNKKVKISATSIPITPKPKATEIIPKYVANDDGMVVIGPNGTMISKNALQSKNCSLSGAALTRKILMKVFDRKTLAFHSLTGKPSPAFMDCDKPMKNQLDPLKVADIIHMVMKHTELTAKEVRNAITTKCADENKMFRQREKKRQNAVKLQRKLN